MKDRALKPVIVSIVTSLVSYGGSAAAIVWGFPLFMDYFALSRYELPQMSTYVLELSDQFYDEPFRPFQFHVPLAFSLTAIVQVTSWYIRNQILLTVVTMTSLIPLFGTLLACVLPLTAG